jgi:hypothetical protein
MDIIITIHKTNNIVSGEVVTSIFGTDTEITEIRTKEITYIQKPIEEIIVTI